MREQKMFESKTGVIHIPAKFTQDQEKALFDALIDAKAFGLEAVKGSLFNSVDKNDLASLLRLRAVGWYSPNPLSERHLKTSNLLIRHVRRTSP
jgi:hypothetical protein